MKDIKLGIIMAIGILIVTVCGTPENSYSAVLTPGQSYVITASAINSDGTTTPLGLRMGAVADSNGKLSFSASDLPTRGQYNFLVVTISDGGGTVVRRSIIPTPNTGQTINLGVSPMTKAQTDALLSALQTAGTDDPIVVLFGFIIVRTGGLTSADITHLANAGRLAIRNGFNAYLRGPSENGVGAKITAAQMTTFRASIVTQLANYCATLKDAVEARDDSTSKNERAEAAALLSQILIEAAATAEFDVGYINAAMKAASDQFEDYLLGDGTTMDDDAVMAVDKVMMSNYMKLSAERVRKKYSLALSTLGATQDQLTRFNNAVTTLSNTLLTAFQEMEELFADEEGSLDGKETEISNKFEDETTGVQKDINDAFGQFLTNSASTNAEIDAMVSAMNTGFNFSLGTLNTMKDPNSDGNYSDGVFTFRDMSGTVSNWPITMVVPVTWVANNHPNDLSYTRDTLGVPTAMWFAARTNFADTYGMPTALAVLFGLREDIEIITARKWTGFAAASRDMTTAGYNKLATGYAPDYALATAQRDAGTLTLLDSEDTAAADDVAGATLASFAPLGDLNPWLTGEEVQGLEDLYLTRLGSRKDDLGPATLTDAQKQALLDTAIMPDFH